MDNPILKMSGIYQILNLVNNKVYVGSTSRSFLKRWNEHKHDFRKNENSPRLQNSWNKYGESAFEFTVLEVCSPEECLIKEQVWIEKLKPVYNISPTAHSCRGIKHSEQTKEKIRRIRTGSRLKQETKDKLSQIGKNRIFTEKHKANLSEAGKLRFQKEKSNLIGVKGKDHPAYGRTGEQSPVAKKVFCLNNGVTYLSVTDAAQKLKLHRQSVGRVARGERPHHRNYQFKFLEETNE